MYIVQIGDLPLPLPSLLSMTCVLQSAKGYLSVTAAASDPAIVGQANVTLKLDLIPVVVPSLSADGDASVAEVEKAVVHATSPAGGSSSVMLDLSLAQTFQLLSELEVLHASLVAAEEG